MVVGTHTGARDGPPTTVLAMTGALMGAATGAATRCVSCNLLVTDGGTRALLTIGCTFGLPFSPLLVFFLGVPYGASLEALGGADLVFVCLEYVGDLPLCFTALILCIARVEGHMACSNLDIMVSLTPRKVVVARVWLDWLYIWATIDHSFCIMFRRIIPRTALSKSTPFTMRPSKNMFICSILGCRLWVNESFIEYTAYISTVILDIPGVPNLVLRLVHVLAHVVLMWGQSVCKMQELIMPCTCSKSNK